MKFLRDLTWLRQAFPPRISPGERHALIDELHDIVMPNVDTLGWSRFKTLEVARASLPNVTNVNINAVPDDEVHLLMYGQVGHDDGAANHTMFLTFVMVDQTGTQRVVQVCEAIATSKDYNVHLPRPLILPPNSFFQGRAVSAVGVGVNLEVMGAFIRLPVGEYIPHVPG